MTLRWLFASVHLLALGIGLGAVWVRARALAGDPTREALQRAFRADALWGVAALLWISTGLVRAFGGLEKGTAYYVSHPLFWAKMGLLGLILVLEVRPMVSLTRWRIRSRRGEPVDASAAHAFARTSRVQAALLVIMVFVATALARGLGR